MEFFGIISELAKAILEGILAFFLNKQIIVITILFIFFLIIANQNYKKTTYYTITHNSLFSVLHNAGNFGEFLIYLKLKGYEKKGSKFLFNVYIPKEDGGTTEIDLMLICANGIIVFESKNYSGWIFGKENQMNWTQTLPQGKGRKSRKENFYSPVMQNKTHIKCLQKIVEDVNLYSVIVFSNRCTLKNVEITSKDIKVVNRYDVKEAIEELTLEENSGLSEIKINEIYNKLYNFTQVDDETREKHIEDIKSEIESKKYKCPKCGGELIKRTAKKGENAGKEFYGCSNFPKCKYVKHNIE